LAGPGYGQDWSYVAEVDLSNYRYRVVVVGTTKEGMKLPTAAGEGRIRGVLQESDVESGQIGRVRKWGMSLVKAAGTINAGDALEIADNLGRVQTLTSSSHACIGEAEIDAVEDQEFEAKIMPIPLDQIHPSS